MAFIITGYPILSEAASASARLSIMSDPLIMGMPHSLARFLDICLLPNIVNVSEFGPTNIIPLSLHSSARLLLSDKKP